MKYEFSMRTKHRVFGALLGITLLYPSLEAREFTDNQGRKVEGEVTAFVAGKVSLKRADGQVFQFPLKLLSDADQKYVNEWIVRNKEFRFDVKSTPRKLDSKKQKGITTVTVEKWAHEVDLRNSSGMDCQDVQVNYWLFVREDDGSGAGRPRLAGSGSEKYPEVGNLRSVALKTNAVELTKTQLSGGYYYADGTRARSSDRLGGIAIRVKALGREVFEFESEDGLLAATGSAGRQKETDDPDR